MSDRNSTNVFVSYSHADASLVIPVVGLLRANQSLVFQDTDRIRPGKKWKDEIATAINQSNLVVVFWCHHSSQSQEVMAEWQAALEQGKDLLPLLLDKTPLPTELRAYQWIDFRGTVGNQHISTARNYLWVALLVFALMVVLLLIIIPLFRPIELNDIIEPTMPPLEDILLKKKFLITYLITSPILLAIGFKITDKKVGRKDATVRCIAKKIGTEIQLRTAAKVS